MWKELRHLGLIPKSVLHGFSPNELNKHFVGVSLQEDNMDVDGILEGAGPRGLISILSRLMTLSLLSPTFPKPGGRMRDLKVLH